MTLSVLAASNAVGRCRPRRGAASGPWDERPGRFSFQSEMRML